MHTILTNFTHNYSYLAWSFDDGVAEESLSVDDLGQQRTKLVREQNPFLSVIVHKLIKRDRESRYFFDDSFLANEFSLFESG